MVNKQRNKETILFLLNTLTLIAIAIVFYYCWHINYGSVVYFYNKGNWLLLSVYMVIIIYLNQLYGGYKINELRFAEVLFSQILAVLISSTVIYIMSSLVSKSILNPLGFIVMFLLEILTIVILNWVILRVFNSLFKPEKTILISSVKEDKIISKINKKNNGFIITETVEFNNDIDKKITQYNCIIANELSAEDEKYLIHKCYEENKYLYIVPRSDQVIAKTSSIVHTIDTPLLKLNSYGPSQISKIIKRIIDITLSLIACVVFSPIMLIVAIMIKLNDNGPIIYSQNRLTENNKIFNIYKFRSMKIDAEKNGEAKLAQENDDRITKVGKIIRMLRLDELPQLFNILIGDMSIVGPRPERPEIVETIKETLPEFDYRLKVKAGLTGYAQVYGKYNTKLKDKLLLDLIYIENYSLLLDIKLILMTIKIIFIKESTEGIEK